MNRQETAGRVAQKARTRQTLLAATRDLLAEGHHPTVAEAADRAQISRATAYRYFSAPEPMAQEAVLDAIAKEFEAVSFGNSPAGSDLATRAEDVVAAILRMVLAHEPLFRTFLSVSSAGTGTPGWRGGRRLGWIRDALAPISVDLPPAQLDLLVTGLALLAGIETVIVLSDVCGLEPGAIEHTARRLARTLVRGVLADA
ncbi:TetR/AcrR family transcriptional regulator [Azorhizobium sp. AG788]|uniref:TetR/AcrR family transcriptional regulator n=1 Tax=Azorhizobium sp. AG788 TaxID=2183897 RepID=UPI003138D4D6